MKLSLAVLEYTGNLCECLVLHTLVKLDTEANASSIYQALQAHYSYNRVSATLKKLQTKGVINITKNKGRSVYELTPVPMLSHFSESINVEFVFLESPLASVIRFRQETSLLLIRLKIGKTIINKIQKVVNDGKAELLRVPNRNKKQKLLKITETERLVTETAIVPQISGTDFRYLQFLKITPRQLQDLKEGKTSYKRWLLTNSMGGSFLIKYILKQKEKSGIKRSVGKKTAEIYFELVKNKLPLQNKKKEKNFFELKRINPKWSQREKKENEEFFLIHGLRVVRSVLENNTTYRGTSTRIREARSVNKAKQYVMRILSTRSHVVENLFLGAAEGLTTRHVKNVEYRARYFTRVVSSVLRGSSEEGWLRLSQVFPHSYVAKSVKGLREELFEDLILAETESGVLLTYLFDSSVEKKPLMSLTGSDVESLCRKSARREIEFNKTADKLVAFLVSEVYFMIQNKKLEVYDMSRVLEGHVSKNQAEIVKFVHQSLVDKENTVDIRIPEMVEGTYVYVHGHYAGVYTSSNLSYYMRRLVRAGVLVEHKGLGTPLYRPNYENRAVGNLGLKESDIF